MEYALDQLKDNLKKLEELEKKLQETKKILLDDYNKLVKKEKENVD